MSYTVQKLATLAGVSVRTLHYYDEIGLLTPARVGSNGYRYYEEKELLKLQQILFFRELEFSLPDIERMMRSPYFDAATALKEHRKLIQLKRARLERLLTTIDNTIMSMNTQEKIEDAELYNAFKDDDVKQYQEEVRKRWGNTDAYRQSVEKVGKMTKAEMEKLKIEGKQHTEAFARAMDKGIQSDEVQTLIAKSHEGVNFFYECSTEMFRNLGQMYVDDPRFTAYYEKFRPGLAVFMRDAIAYYCDQKEGKK
jgi:DNA-binding transcriptional MerR regulator